MPTIRIVIADDHEIVRQGVKNLLTSEPDMEICGEATMGRDAVDLVAKLKPDVAILDISMPGLNGIEVTRQILKSQPKIKVLMFTMHDAEQLVHEVFSAGAKGYLLKSDAGRHLVSAVRTVASGSPYFSSRLSQTIFEGFLKKDLPHVVGSSDQKSTSREREIIQLLAEGKSNKEVAAVLGISVKTAETHRAAVMRKLGLHSVSELVRYAIRNHIIEA
ncbi:response regulator transcription factor [soil metagenome]